MSKVNKLNDFETIDKINARDCSICEIPLENEKSFLDSNHSQGYAKSRVCYGLYKNNELVQVMSFGVPRFNKNYQWEIIRECTAKGYLVRGGTSKLWKFFLKNNSCHSCICYHYPHNKDYTNHLVDYCEFKCIKRAKPEKKLFFEGIWNGKYKKISKPILERHGVDRLLNVNEGKERTNEQILLDLGFKKKYEDGYSSQIDIYYPFGIVFRVDDLTDGTFYIGMTEVKYKWDNGYMGSGGKWHNHLNKHPDKKEEPDNENAHTYSRTVLHYCDNPKKTRDLELLEINKVFNDDKNMNTHVRTQGSAFISSKCPECGMPNGLHRIYCKKANLCDECGGRIPIHKCSCSKAKTCEECGAVNGKHKTTCSKAKRCSECGSVNGLHKSSCSKSKRCSECGRTNGNHKKTCSKAKSCEECGGMRGNHKKWCSKAIVCEECGSIGGSHKKDCSKVKKCPECGASYNHLKTCSHYKHTEACDECGAIIGHKATCSKAVVCEECGGKCGHHSKDCSKAKICEICGMFMKHKKDCPNAIICPECGGKRGHHKKTCSKYNTKESIKICQECGGRRGNHKKVCSKYKYIKNNKIIKEEKWITRNTEQELLSNSINNFSQMLTT